MMTDMQHATLKIGGNSRGDPDIVILKFFPRIR